MSKAQHVLILDPTGRFEKHGDFLLARKRMTCFRGYDRQTGMEVTWHELSMSSLNLQQRKSILKRVEYIKHISHPILLSLIHYWTAENDKLLYYITESVSTSSIGDRIDEGFVGSRPAAVAKWFIAVLEALDYLHSLNPPIEHRGIDLYSIFIKPSSAKIKLSPPVVSSFALDSRYNSVAIRNSTAPEVILGTDGPQSDIWCIGVAFLRAITQAEPYEECRTPHKLVEKITSFQTPNALEIVGDNLAKDFIRLCLQPTDMRPTAKELLKHPFFAQEFTNRRDVVPTSDGIELLFTSKDVASHDNINLSMHNDRHLFSTSPNLHASTPAPR